MQFQVVRERLFSVFEKVLPRQTCLKTSVRDCRFGSRTEKFEPTIVPVRERRRRQRRQNTIGFISKTTALPVHYAF